MASLTLYGGLLLLHIASVFGFLLVHGISIAIVLQLRRDHDVEHVRALLSLSRTSVGGIHFFTLLVIATGLVLGFLGLWYGFLWFWMSLGLFLALGVGMHFFGTRFYDRVRLAVGVEPFYKVKANRGGPPTPERIEELLTSPRPVILTVVGLAVLLVILWLMMFKPF